MITTKTKQRAIYKLANNEPIRQTAKSLGIDKNSVLKIKKENATKIGQVKTDISNKQDTLNGEILFYAKHKLLSLLKSNKKQSGNELSNITKSLDTIQRLDDNKPTSITDSKKLANATTMELLNEYETRLRDIRSNSTRA